MTIKGDELVALLEGNQGEVGVASTVAFDASKSFDPSDTANALAPLTFDFNCKRIDSELIPCFSKSYGGTRSGSKWSFVPQDGGMENGKPVVITVSAWCPRLMDALEWGRLLWSGSVAPSRC